MRTPDAIRLYGLLYERRTRYAERHNLRLRPGKWPDGGIWGLPAEADALHYDIKQTVQCPPVRPQVARPAPIWPQGPQLPAPHIVGPALACCGTWEEVTTLPHMCSHCKAVYFEEEPCLNAL